MSGLAGLESTLQSYGAMSQSIGQMQDEATGQALSGWADKKRSIAEGAASANAQLDAQGEALIGLAAGEYPVYTGAVKLGTKAYNWYKSNAQAGTNNSTDASGVGEGEALTDNTLSKAGETTDVAGDQGTELSEFFRPGTTGEGDGSDFVSERLNTSANPSADNTGDTPAKPDTSGESRNPFDDDFLESEDMPIRGTIEPGLTPESFQPGGVNSSKFADGTPRPSGSDPSISQPETQTAFEGSVEQAEQDLQATRSGLGAAQTGGQLTAATTEESTSAAANLGGTAAATGGEIGGDLAAGAGLAAGEGAGVLGGLLSADAVTAAIPVVGEVAAVGTAIYAGVEGLLDLFGRHKHPSTPPKPPPPTIQGASVAAQGQLVLPSADGVVDTPASLSAF